MKKPLALVLSAIITLCTPAFAMQEADRTKMSKDHQRVYDAALALYGIVGNEARFECTATVIAQRQGQPGGKIDEYLLLTAGHCVTGDGTPNGIKFGVRENIVENGPVTPDLQLVDVVRAENDAKYDFAILFLATDKVYPVIDIDINYVPVPEDKVYDVNFSLGITKQIALGVIASGIIDTQTSHGDCDICKGRYMVHIFAAGGASGSAIINEKTNKIIGVGEFGFPGTTTGLGCETMKAFKEWATSPVASNLSPKAQSLQASRVAQ